MIVFCSNLANEAPVLWDLMCKAFWFQAGPFGSLRVSSHWQSGFPSPLRRKRQELLDPEWKNTEADFPTKNTHRF